MRQRKFKLNKWFLDFVGEDGTAMIFYAAELRWCEFVVPYSSCLYYDPKNGVSQKSRFRKIQMPEKRKNLIRWSDSKFKVEGLWESLAEPIYERLFDSEEGFLDWKCYQPASKVKLNINNSIIEGKGYVEQLVLTIPPWKIPMNELRWGHFGSNGNQMVWIELKAEDKKQWLWLNGEKMGNSIIEDDLISIPEKGIILKLNKRVTLESAKKVYTLTEKLLHYIPGFINIIPMKFLMADEYKWLSKGQLQRHGGNITTGIAIHEFVNFNTKNQ